MDHEKVKTKLENDLSNIDDSMTSLEITNDLSNSNDCPSKQLSEEIFWINYLADEHTYEESFPLANSLLDEEHWGDKLQLENDLQFLQ